MCVFVKFIDQVPGRTRNQCRQRWLLVLQAAFKKVYVDVGCALMVLQKLVMLISTIQD